MTTLQKVLFMAVIPEVLNRESIFFKKLRTPGFPPSSTTRRGEGKREGVWFFL